jgi:hypothetical protein
MIAKGRRKLMSSDKRALLRRTQLAAMATVVGVDTAKKDARIGGRISRKLVRIAKRKTGITSDSALIEAGLLNLATEDDFGRWLVDQAGRLDKDFLSGL